MFLIDEGEFNQKFFLCQDLFWLIALIYPKIDINMTMTDY